MFEVREGGIMKNCVKCIIALLFFLMCFLALQGLAFAEEIVTYEYEAESGVLSGPHTKVIYDEFGGLGWNVVKATNSFLVYFTEGKNTISFSKAEGKTFDIDKVCLRYVGYKDRFILRAGYQNIFQRFIQHCNI